jgi:hypothetical protein
VNAAYGVHITDPNSPELFKQNIQLSLQELDRVQALARSVLDNM